MEKLDYQGISEYVTLISAAMFSGRAVNYQHACLIELCQEGLVVRKTFVAPLPLDSPLSTRTQGLSATLVVGAKCTF